MQGLFSTPGAKTERGTGNLLTTRQYKYMFIGYGRVSTTDQTLDLQLDALEKIGCKEIFTDTISGAKVERKELDQALSYVREEDTFVVWKLDKLAEIPSQG